MKLDKTTIRMAERRGVSLFVTEDDELQDGRTTVEISALVDGEPADEYDALYVLDTDGLHFRGSCSDDSEEWPNWIRNVEHLRALLPAMAEEVRR